MKCELCGRENPESAQFCGNCGNSLTAQQETTLQDTESDTSLYYESSSPPIQHRGTFISRMIGACMLSAYTFEDVESDTSATTQALMVVLIVSFAGSFPLLLQGNVKYFAVMIFAGIIFWLTWALVTYTVGGTILKTLHTEANWGELLRTTGFAQTPGLFGLIGIIPILGQIIALPIMIWQIIAMVIGIKHALDYSSNLRAVGVVVLAFVPATIINLTILAILLGMLGIDPTN